MARGTKKNSVAGKKAAIHKMVEALIGGDADLAAEELHKYLQVKTRELILGESDEKEEKEEKEEKDEDESEEKEDESEEDESDEDESEEKEEKEEKKSKKKDLKESKHGNSLRDVPHKSNDTKAKAGLKKIAGSTDKGVENGKIKGNSFKSKPKKSNDTKAKAGLGKITGSNDKGVQKDKVNNKTDGRDYDMGTGNI